MNEEHRTPDVGVAVWQKRKNITVSEDLFDAFVGLKRKGETHSMLLERMINLMHSIDTINNDIKGLEEEIDALWSKSRARQIRRRSQV